MIAHITIRYIFYNVISLIKIECFCILFYSFAMHNVIIYLMNYIFKKLNNFDLWFIKIYTIECDWKLI